MQALQTCDNCQRQFPSFKIHSHFSYCVRNIKKCSQCGDMVDMNHLDEHNEEFHSKLPCTYCKKEFDPKTLEGHKKACEYRTVTCEYCEQSVPMKQFEEHQEACGARTSPCPICERPVVLKTLYEHASTCEGKPPQPEPVTTTTGNSYQDYINREREKLGMQPRVISTTVTVRSEEPSSVRVLPIQKVTIKPSELNSTQPRVIRYEPTQILTRTISYKSQTPSETITTYTTRPAQTTKITYVTREPVESKITYMTKEPVITRKISEVKYEEGLKVYGGIDSIQTTEKVYGGGYQSGGQGGRIPGFEDEDEELQRALMESMMMQ